MTGPRRAVRTPTRSCSASPARCGPRGAGHPGPGAGLPRRGRRWSGSTTSAATYWPGRATLCAGPDDLERYDQVFEAWFNARDGLPRPRPAERRRRRRSPGCRWPRATATATARPTTTVVPGDGQRRPRCCGTATSPRCRAAEKAPAGRDVRDPAAAGRRGGVPPGTSAGTAATSTRHRTLRASLRRMGEPAEIAWRRRGDPAAPGGAAGRRVRLDERVRRRAAAAGAPAAPRPARRARSRRSPSAPG